MNITLSHNRNIFLDKVIYHAESIENEHIVVILCTDDDTSKEMFKKCQKIQKYLKTDFFSSFKIKLDNSSSIEFIRFNDYVTNFHSDYNIVLYIFFDYFLEKITYSQGRIFLYTLKDINIFYYYNAFAYPFARVNNIIIERETSKGPLSKNLSFEEFCVQQNYNISSHEIEHIMTVLLYLYFNDEDKSTLDLEYDKYSEYCKGCCLSRHIMSGGKIKQNLCLNGIRLGKTMLVGQYCTYYLEFLVESLNKQ